MEVERRALNLMARLRPHQLLHPELVTEGMNRLAQAMLAVTSFGVSKPTTLPPKPPPTPAVPPPAIDLAPRLIEPTVPTTEPAVLEAEAVVLDAEPLPSDTVAQVELPPRRRQTPPPQKTLRSLLPELPQARRIRIGPTAADRRNVYYQLAGWRGLLDAWDKLKPWLANPTESLDTPAAVFDFLEAIDACRQAQQHRGLRGVEWADEAPFVQSLLRQSQVLPVFRSLVYGQRQGLATDWARAKARWQDQAEELRLAVRSAARELPRPFWGTVSNWLSANPEWLLGLASILVLLLALSRMVLSIVNRSPSA